MCVSPLGWFLEDLKGFEDFQVAERREGKRGEGNCINFDLGEVFLRPVTLLKRNSSAGVFL